MKGDKHANTTAIGSPVSIGEPLRWVPLVPEGMPGVLEITLSVY